MVRCQYPPVNWTYIRGRPEPGGQELRTRVRGRLWLLMPAALLGLLILPAAAAEASIGIGIQAGPVRLSSAAHPGGTYQLPAVYVVNTGSAEESVVLKLQRISPGRGLTIPPSWIIVSSAPVRLGHNQSARIPLQLSVPADARPGRYFSDVIAHGSGRLSAGHANLGVAAATGLDLTIAPGAVAHPWLVIPGWFWPALGGLIVVAAGIFWIGSSGIRIRIERRPGPGSVSEGTEHADIA
jgi:hypothetical protein